VPRDLKIRGYTVGQFPSPPLWVALVALLMARLTEGAGTVNDLARAVFYVALTVWAYEEAASGVNGFRRALGAVALVLIVVAVSRAVG
jgi:hypothetical protein